MSPPLMVTEDTPPDMLAGAMDLRLVLPNGSRVKTSVDRRTPMMDLLVQVTTAYKISPAGHVLQPYGESGLLPYKPSTPIGALDTWTVHIVPKHQALQNPANKISLKQVIQPFEQTFRFQVNLPRNQLFVTRVNGRTTMGEILEQACREKGLDINKYTLKNPKQLDGMSLCEELSVAEYGHNQVSMVSNRALPSSVSSEDILAMHKYTNSSKSCESSSRSLSPDSSVSPRQPIQPSRPLRKRRPAPKPPVSVSQQPQQPSQPVNQQVLFQKESTVSTNGPVICHSRTSSDSSGYHEASVLSESPDSNNSSLPDSLPRRSKLPSNHVVPNCSGSKQKLSRSLSNLHQASTSTAIVNGSLPHNSAMKPAQSTSSLAPSRKKKPAPPPPVFSIAEEREETSSTASRTSKTLPPGTRLQECHQTPLVVSPPQPPPSPPVELPVEPPQTKPVPPPPISRIPDCVDNVVPRGNALNPSHSLVKELKSVFSSFQERSTSPSSVCTSKRSSYCTSNFLKQTSSICENQKPIPNQESSPPSSGCSVKELISRFDTLNLQNNSPIASRQPSFRNKIAVPTSPNSKCTAQPASPNSKLTVQISSPKQDISDSSSPGSSLSVSSVIFNFKINALNENLPTPPSICSLKQETNAVACKGEEILEEKSAEKLHDQEVHCSITEVPVEKVMGNSVLNESSAEYPEIKGTNLEEQVIDPILETSKENDIVSNRKTSKDIAKWLESILHQEDREATSTFSNHVNNGAGETQVAEYKVNHSAQNEAMNPGLPNSLPHPSNPRKTSAESDKADDDSSLTFHKEECRFNIDQASYWSPKQTEDDEILSDISEINEIVIPYIDQDEELLCCSSREKSMADDDSEIKSVNDFHEVSFVEDISTVDSRDIISTEEEHTISEDKKQNVDEIINNQIKSTVISSADVKNDKNRADVEVFDSFTSTIPRVSLLKKESSSDTDALSEFSVEEEEEVDDQDSPVVRTKTVTFQEESPVVLSPQKNNNNMKEILTSPMFKLKSLKQHGKKLWNRARSKQKVRSSNDWFHRDVISTTQGYCSCEEPDIVYVRAPGKCVRTNAFKVKTNQKPLMDDGVLKSNELLILENQLIREKLKELLDSRPEAFL